MKRVVLFACIEKNIGDDLFVYVLANRYKNTNFIITNEAKYGSLEKVSNLVFDEELTQWIKHSNAIHRNPVKEIARRYKLRKLGNNIGRFDAAVYIVGNAFKNYCYTGKRDSQWIKDRLDLADNFFLLSTNFGPYNNPKWKHDFDSIFSKMNDVCFRDKTSYNLFANLSNVRFKPDAVLSLGFQKHISSDYIIISMIDCMLDNRPLFLKNIGKAFEEKIVEVIEYYSHRGKKIILLDSNKEQDRPASERISNLTKQLFDVKIFDYSGDLDELLNLYSHAEMVIGTRLHTIILAFLFDIPVLPIVYDIKVTGILNSCLFTGEAINIEDISSINASSVDSIMKNYKFHLPEKVVVESNMQFSKLDDYLF